MKTQLYRASNLKSTITFMAFNSQRKSISGAREKPSILAIYSIIIIIIYFFAQVFWECTEVVATSLIPLVINFPEICAFIIGFSFTVWTKKSAKKIRKLVTECLQNLYQSVFT